MLKDYIKQGVKIEGLFDLISTGKDAFDGSWTFESHLTSPNCIRFFGDGSSGKHAVRILPYKRGENANTPMAGDEVISGEFTGCIMAVYKNLGLATVTHVDTEKNDEGLMPQKDAWEALKHQSGFELFNESSTKGLIPQFIAGMSDKKLREYGTGIVILCVASPTKYYSITRACCYRDSAHNYKVLKIL